MYDIKDLIKALEENKLLRDKIEKLKRENAKLREEKEALIEESAFGEDARDPLYIEEDCYEGEDAVIENIPNNRESRFHLGEMIEISEKGSLQKMIELPKGKEFIKTAKETGRNVLFIKNNGDIGVVTYGYVEDYGADREYELYYGIDAHMPVYVFEETEHATPPTYVNVEDVFEYSLEGLKQANERVKDVLDKKIEDLGTRIKRVSSFRTKKLSELLEKK